MLSFGMEPNRGKTYPAEGMDGSPFFLGKPRKRVSRFGTASGFSSSEKNPLAERNKVDEAVDEIFIDDTESDPEPPPAKSAKSINRCKGTLFDFSEDPDVASLNRAVLSVIDPEGKRKNDERVQASLASAASKKHELMTEKPLSTKKKNQKGWSHKDYGGAATSGFRMASGKAVVKEMKSVVPAPASESSSEGKSDGTSGMPRFFGSKPIQPSSKKVMMNMVNSGGGFDSRKGGLRAEPTLKHLDDNIISLIESEIMSVSLTTGWSDVAGLEGAKKALREIVVLPFKRPDVFKGIRAPPKGVLLFGPPGTGKTMIGKCVASQCKATFFNISASSLTSKWVGEGEKLVRALFAVARIKLPSVIFIDEIDSLLSARSGSEHESSRRIKTEFLVQLDGVATSSDERLLVLGATNRPHELDEAARRRFAKRLYIALPEDAARLDIVRNLMMDMENSLTDEDYRSIGELTKGYSGADMRQLCAEAAMGPIREIDSLPDLDIETIKAEEIRPISGADFIEATKVVRATVVAEDLDLYKKWDAQFGCLL